MDERIGLSTHMFENELNMFKFVKYVDTKPRYNNKCVKILVPENSGIVNMNPI